MNYIDLLFSEELKNKFSSENNSELINIDDDLSGLVTAGICNEWSGDLLLLLPENSNLYEFRAKLSHWMNLVGSKRDIIVFPLPFGDPYINNRIYPDYHIEKFNLLRKKLKNIPVIVIATMLSASIGIERPEKIDNMIFSPRVKEKISMNDMIEKLYEMGYSHSNFVDEPGEFHKRGGILDLYPSGTEYPARIEFYGNEIESITLFNRVSRRSVRQIDLIDIPLYGLFGREMKFSEMISGKFIESLTDILDNLKLIYNSRSLVESSAEKSMENFREIFKLNDGSDIQYPDKLFREISPTIPALNISEKSDDISYGTELKKWEKNLREFNTGDLEELRDVSVRSNVFLFTKSNSLKENLRDGGIRLKSEDFIIPDSFVNLSTSSFFYTDRKFIFRDNIADIDESESEGLLKTLVPGEYIVHEKHGIGIFRGLQLLKFGNFHQEFIKTEYMNNEILYVPVSKANVLNKYFSFKGEPGKLDRIGGKSWNQKKIRARKSIIRFAKELLDLYSLRRSIKGFSHEGDSELEYHLKSTFPYIETPDQITAIADVMSDLKRDFPMERLICGDVSFGKTEVAIRASLRVVSSGRQVAVLCPTTILAMQHFRTFSNRMDGLPVKIKMLSRMVSTADRRRISEELENGDVDILIGTHSILSSKTDYRNLGLLIIDEEQRFGVFQKEKLKQGRENVDVLILSATPIPRTLSLSMAGLQDISTIRTPPKGRLKIRNYIGEFSRQIIVSAILKEMQRKGGVYIIYNSIEKIFTFKDLLNKWIPEIKIGVIHSQMNNNLIEKNLLDFINGNYSILLSTTIIENGIDIANVNTLIVIDAEKFGLTQLYQLRGRIGRGERQAYAYFLTGSKVVTEKARLRLKGIRDYSDVGSGFKLAEYDLKLRGAGSLLGSKQHGHIEALGFDYYNAMLKQSVDELKGKKTREWNGEVKVNFRYSIGSEYISDGTDRMDFYSQIINAEDLNEIESIRNDMFSRFGNGGENVSKIFYVAKVKLIASEAGTTNVSIFSDRFVFEFNNSERADFILGKLLANDIVKFKKSGNSISFDYEKGDVFLDILYKSLKS